MFCSLPSYKNNVQPNSILLFLKYQENKKTSSTHIRQRSNPLKYCFLPSKRLELSMGPGLFNSCPTSNLSHESYPANFFHCLNQWLSTRNLQKKSRQLSLVWPEKEKPIKKWYLKDYWKDHLSVLSWFLASQFQTKFFATASTPIIKMVLILSKS